MTAQNTETQIDQSEPATHEVPPKAVNVTRPKKLRSIPIAMWHRYRARLVNWCQWVGGKLCQGWQLFRRHFVAWRREWAVFDLLVLLSCTTLTFSHFYPEKLRLTKKWEELIPNVAAEVFGAWLSIRFINYLIEKRSKYHTARRWLLNGLYHFMQIARSISLDSNKGQIDFLVNELRTLTGDVLPKMNGKLFPDETKLINDLTNQEREIILQLKKYFDAHQQASDSWRGVKRTCTSLPTSIQNHLSTLESYYEVFLKNYSDRGEHMEIYIQLIEIAQRQNETLGQRRSPTRVPTLINILKRLIENRCGYLTSLASFEKTWQSLKNNISEETDLLP